MTHASCLPLIELLRAPDPDLDRVIRTFVTCFNDTYGDPAKEHWDITKAEWERFEFLGDRVLNLVIAQGLFTKRQAALTEGEMTKILSSVVSNPALSAFMQEQAEATFGLLIPEEIGGQKTYGDRIIGGGFEALIGALYCELGLDDVAAFVSGVLKDSLSRSDPDENAIGVLQEYFQKHYKRLPDYRETKRTGPDHRRTYTYEVLFNNTVLGMGTGERIREAKQAAARQALITLMKKE